MKRLTPNERKLIKKLVKKGYSLNKIVKKLGIKKTTVYYWYRKFSSKRIKKIIINENLEEEIGEIVGAFCGDGNFYLGKNYSYRIRFYLSGNELEYCNNLNTKLNKVFGKAGNVLRYSNLLVIDIFGRDIIKFIKLFVVWTGNRTHTIRLINNPKKYSLKFLRGFCRGVFDTEGWVTKNNLMVNCTSDDLMKNLSDSLHTLKIPHLLTTWKRKDKAPTFAIYLNKKNTIKYFDTIGSSNPKRIKNMLPTGISGI